MINPVEPWSHNALNKSRESSEHLESSPSKGDLSNLTIDPTNSQLPKSVIDHVYRIQMNSSRTSDPDLRSFWTTAQNLLLTSIFNK